MDTKLLVTLRRPEEAQIVRDAGCEILAEYPNSLLVRCTEAQQEALRQAGLEMTELPQETVQISGMSFAFEHALEADVAAPIAPDPNRKAYYLVRLVGPAKGEWLEAIRALGGAVQSKLRGFTLVVGILPARLQELQELPWVEAVTPYRSAMKVSPKLRPGVSRELSTAALTTLDLESGEPNATVQVEISVFPDESTAPIAAQVRAAGGIILGENSKKVIAIMSPDTITGLANDQSVQAIAPHAFPQFHNDQATQVMDAPPNRIFGDLTLPGTGQIVAVADSGLDTGNAATVHADFAGRVVNIISLPIRPELSSLVNNPGADDGAQDTNSSHGTHVAGSVLGNGTAATAASSSTVPRGMAPEARLYFQAVEQQANWKSAAQLIAEGVPPAAIPPTWPPPAIGLYGLPDDLNNLFNQAYTAGGRIHTNSWGAPIAGIYSDNSAEVDNFMWNNRDMLILFSAGNAGLDLNTDTIIDQDSIGAPGTAKNCLTVGASENNRPSGSTPTPGIDANWNVLGPAGGPPTWPALGPAGHVSDNVEGMAAFSSRGPTDDGRIKPDVVAPGTNVLSTRSSTYAGANPPLWGDVTPSSDPLNGLYCWSGGTSMSTPLVAGTAALIRQHLVQQRGHFQNGVKPSGALIKAFLINGAAPMAGQFAGEIPAGPNNVNGFGRVNLTESLIPDPLTRTLFADEPDYAVETGQIRTFQVKVMDTLEPLKVTLVWTDAPGPVNIGGLQNELYLQVVRPDMTVVDGDVNPFPNATNNVQQVVISSPIVGTYEIRVRGVSVTQQAPGASTGPNPRQDFALVVSNGMGFSVQPVSIAQAIDTTGSMGFFGYMEPAKERATQLVDFMRINDKVSITEFSQRSGVPNDARTPYSLRLLGDFTPDWTDAHTAISGLHAEGRTPIGAGLQEAWNQLMPEPTARPRAIVLLSDGFNNEPPDPFSVLPSIPADVPIFTIALGPASSIPTLQNIAASRPNGAYYSVESDEDVGRLHEIYAQVQALAAGAALIGLSSAEVESQSEEKHEMSVEPGIEEATFALSWTEGREMEFIVTGPDGSRYDNTTAATVERRGSSYHLVRIAVPEPGPWSLLVRNQGSEKPVGYTVSGAVQSALTLSAEVPKVGDERLVVTARLRRGATPWDEAKVVARVTMPTRSRQEVLQKFEDRIRELQLPEEVQEKGLSEEQILLLKLSVFAREFGSEEGGLYGRKSFEVELSSVGDGTWVTEAPIHAPGNASVEVIARGEIGGVPWERHATQSVQVPEAITPVRKLSIKDIFVRRNQRWGYSIIGTRVLKADSTPAIPEDSVQVSMVMTQGNQRAESGNLPYYKRGQYYIWRLQTADFKKNGGATVTVQVRLGKLVVTEAVTDSTSVTL